MRAEKSLPEEQHDITLAGSPRTLTANHENVSGEKRWNHARTAHHWTKLTKGPQHLRCKREDDVFASVMRLSAHYMPRD